MLFHAFNYFHLVSAEILKCYNFYVFSGGYNIKTGPGCSIELMKSDMGGSAAVLGAAKAIGQIKPAGVEVGHLCCSLSCNHYQEPCAYQSI